MHILLVASAFNSLTQRVHAELRDHGHTVAVELALPGSSLTEAVRRHAPRLVLAPMLRTAIPREVWSAHTCLVVHPGPVGDRGPSSLDWALHEGVDQWGVTVLQADEEMDAGDVWATAPCPLPPTGKSDLYRNEIADAALKAVLLAVARVTSGTYTPRPQNPSDAPHPQRPSDAPHPQGPSDAPHPQGPSDAPHAQGPSDAARPQGPPDAPHAQGPSDAPRRQEPAHEPHSQGPAYAGHSLGPADAPRCQGPAHEPHPQGPAHAPRSEDPADAPRRQGPAHEPHSQDPAQAPHPQDPAQAPHPQAPAPTPHPQSPAPTNHTGPRTRPYLDQSVRRIDWAGDSTTTVLRKLRAADSQPGVLDALLGGEWYLHGGHPEGELRGRPGELLATRTGAVCRATRDGAVWIPELRPRRVPGAPPTFKLPAVQALGDLLPALPEAALPPLFDARRPTWAEIRYREEGNAGFLSFSFPGGAMSTTQCRRLLAAYREACARPTSVLVLGGARDFFSNGIHLNVIEAAADPAAESCANIEAIDDLVEAVLTTTDRLVISAVAGNAAAGGVMLALAADEVWCRSGAVLNPHYRLMGLYGSEYWTYTLPRRVGPAAAERLMSEALPVSAASAERLGLVDRVLDHGPGDFAAETARLAARLAALPASAARIAAKKSALDRLESTTPLSGHRERELTRMRATFLDPDAPYHALRRAFVRKERPPHTPPHLAATAP